MPLTDITVRTAKGKDKAYKLSDEKGLYLYVTPSGKKYWRLKYRYNGKEKLLALGVYPEVSLSLARDRRNDARKLKASEIDPGEHRKVMKTASANRATNSFELVAREWFAKHSVNWVASHADKIIRRLERDIFPWLGAKPISEITPPDLLIVLRRIEERGSIETAHRAMGNCGQIFRYGVATGRAERDPSQDLKGALPPVKSTHFAAQTNPQQFAQLLKVINSYEGTLIVRCALRLAPYYLFVLVS